MNTRRLILLLMVVSGIGLGCSSAHAALGITIDTLAPNMGTATIADFDAGFRDKVKNWMTKLLEGRKTSKIPVPGYRHLVGKLAPKKVKKSQRNLTKSREIEP